MVKEYEAIPEYIEYKGSLFKLVESGLTHVEDICIHTNKNYADLFKDERPPMNGNVAQSR